jgi:hypothetical protein
MTAMMGSETSPPSTPMGCDLDAQCRCREMTPGGGGLMISPLMSTPPSQPVNSPPALTYTPPAPQYAPIAQAPAPPTTGAT